MTARSCPQCGAAVDASDDFCGNCGNYLGWGARPAPPAPVAERSSRDVDAAGGPRVEEPGSRGAVDEPPVREGGWSPGPRGATGGPPVEESGWPPDPPGAVGPSAAAGVVDEPRGAGAVDPPGPPGAPLDAAGRRDERSAGGPRQVGGAAGDRAAGYLGPVTPGRPDAKRPLPTTGADVSVVGPPCPNCGTTNPPDRRFCRRCATPLHPDGTATPAARRGRWRWRGDRSRWLRRLAALLAVVVLVVAAWLFHPKALELWEDLRDRLATAAPVAPAGVTANAEVPGHPATSAADGLSNRYWGAPAVGDEVRFAFAAPFRLLSLVVHTGASAEEEGFAGQARPTTVDVLVTTADGGTRALTLHLEDRPGPQRTDTGISDVVEIRFTVRTAAGLAEGRHVALGEVEFFRRP
ncbi:zinc-ribbon domain-containing protein [Saccharothrix obliqua]|uniref:zinc-ribbon domain-containing protein n=1 Tax=Saccharothrix obliqua TaxID=2861747 RepID=UPI001C5F0C70|nr:zinc-ribbon domain-containing protein [Saccharothrix obliqua]MBW4720277.1 zinc ribbon domain-containing protein [Saccharothrix obliqua]